MAESEVYIATEPISIDGQPAYQPGHEVHPDNVKLHGLQDRVARQGTKAAEKAVEQPSQ